MVPPRFVHPASPDASRNHEADSHGNATNDATIQQG